MATRPLQRKCRYSAMPRRAVWAHSDSSSQFLIPVTFQLQRQFRAAVLESELRLPPHQGYLLLPDGLPVARIGLTAEHITRRGPPRQPAFVAGDPASTLWSRVSAVAAPAEDEPNAGTKDGPEAGPV